MNFRTIRDAIITTLGTGAAGNFRVVGFQKQAEAAEQNIDTDRSVQVFYDSGEFPKSSGSLSGNVMHDMTFALELTAAKASAVDLTVLENPASTPAQIQAAFAAKQNAADLADKSLDEMIDLIYQVLMDARQQNFGLSFEVADRWIDDVRKNRPITYGQYVVISGVAQLTCAIDEQASGDDGVLVEDMDFDIPIKDDPVGKAGVLVEQP